MWNQSFCALGATFSIEAPMAVGDLLDDLFRSYARGSGAPAELLYRVSAESPHQIWRGQHLIATCPSPLDIAPRLEVDLYWQLAERAPGWALHAASVSLDGGGALVFVGASGAGKSTTALALCQARNAVYLSDELVVINREREVFGLPRPVVCDGEWRLPSTEYGMRDQAGRPLSERLYHPRRARVAEPLALSALVMLERGTERFVEIMEPGPALVAMWPETVNPAPETLELATQLLAGTTVLRLCSGQCDPTYEGMAKVADMLV